ncbi:MULTISPECIES: hypothetical protein [Aerosakkonema]|uniref:hypothetical protein n=1 Tax=Aerosakkonema TaxID=1246629 RepID=UPI0035B913A2
MTRRRVYLTRRRDAIAHRRVVTILAVTAIACGSLPSGCCKLVTVIALWECDRISCRSNIDYTRLTSSLFPLP